MQSLFRAYGNFGIRLIQSSNSVGLLRSQPSLGIAQSHRFLGINPVLSQKKSDGSNDESTWRRFAFGSNKNMRSSDKGDDKSQTKKSSARNDGQHKSPKKSGGVRDVKYESGNRSGLNQQSKGKSDRESASAHQQQSHIDQKAESRKRLPDDSSRKQSQSAGPNSVEAHQSGSKQRRSTNNKASPAFGSSGSGVEHDKSAKRYIMDLGNSQIAWIEYKPKSSGAIEMYHTEVPEQLRGRGIGKALARGAIERASGEGKKIKLTCSYLINYMNKFADETIKKHLVK